MLKPEIRALAHGRNFAAITTLLPDGSPSTHVMWVDADSDHILINTEVHRLKYQNVQRDPRVSVIVWETENPYRYAEVRGRVTETVGGAEARAHIDQLAMRYTGQPYDPAQIQSERVILKITPERQRI